MNDYEITYLSHPELADETRAQLDAAVDQELGRLEAAVSHTAPHIPRRLGYPIQGARTAGLRAVQAQLEPGKVEKLHHFLKKADGVLRFTILRTPYRQDAGPEMAEQLRARRGGKGKVAPAAPKKPAQSVTMEEVEKGIESALTEEVK